MFSSPSPPRLALVRTGMDSPCFRAPVGWRPTRLPASLPPQVGWLVDSDTGAVRMKSVRLEGTAGIMRNTGLPQAWQAMTARQLIASPPRAAWPALPPHSQRAAQLSP